MLLRIASDMHLEFFAKYGTEELLKFMLPPHPADAKAVLVLAGDISATPTQLMEALRLLEPRFRRVLFVAGNHEYYRNDFKVWNKTMKRFSATAASTTVAADKLVEVVVDGVLFICCTLWGDASGSHETLARGLADFTLIQYGTGRMTPQDMSQLNYQHRMVLLEALKRFNGPKVVVTHHLPSHSLCHPRFGPSINGGFASACDSLMKGIQAPVLWVHGHTHDSIDTHIGRTRVVCNPVGYRPEWGGEHNTYFNAPKFIDLQALVNGSAVKLGEDHGRL